MTLLQLQSQKGYVHPLRGTRLSSTTNVLTTRAERSTCDNPGHVTYIAEFNKCLEKNGMHKRPETNWDESWGY